ncbi:MULTISPECIES: chromosome segregation protein SMC [Geobacillus]|uniref:Chromosome partition protein Smc n=1 Tax=Geobacillus thermodenitrificans (strain NG80-2) TaxID=420246 RepID=A4IM68_GEOTN|nr:MULTISPECIES: chromosome segregation protein SMC [Geobacillus]ABO66422.1 SMC protein (Chromosome partition protein) [Geobacillus thermodenitrificans NG80-2]MEC5188551.1 chromosome segregation protein [Geobacillus thermodenitrificans]MED0663691.1 chromosome segregation protein SMC [Geobacillus thermodenitrificans]MED3715780.1 chromosome segregation protein SMC [Geobacillus thermodenitrificans]MED4919151.1 chromosome segregation protein SMC [Geobacillus thermodenitrificans]
MFLKRLDVIGFKSFADRVSIDFVPGVTAVVGPNGSGKSNITDAIRWVLGEQSVKSLRGAKMEDVIFAGSDSRKPLNVAEVTITLDNEDGFLPLEYQEVSVTRRVYRSGESEFFINRQPCRLKDIVDLFLDSGLGKEAFSIIGQGRVEEILSSKPEERRTIFEEAAGVLKYKLRKKKAETKLAETQDNLQRVNDILHELGQQLEPLRMQASIAKEYLEKREELERFEVALMVHDIEQLHRQWSELNEALNEHQQEEGRLAAELQKTEAHIEQLRDQITAIDESVDGLQQVLLLASEELEKLEGRKEVLKERKKHASQRIEQLDETVIALTEKRRRLTEQLRSEKAALTQLEAGAAALEKELKEQQALLSAHEVDIEEEIERRKGDYIDLVHEQAVLKNERLHVEQAIHKLRAKQAALNEANSDHLKQRNQLEQQRAALLAELSRLEQAITEASSKLAALESALKEQQVELEQKETSLHQARQYRQQAKARQQWLEEMQHEYAGFFQGVKEVLKARNRLPGIRGAIVELIRVPDRYEIAIETALGGAMQHIVVDSEQAARQAIHFLKTNGYGRATFLPLDVIQARSLSERERAAISGHPAFVGIASELIEYDDIYAAAIAHLLGHVIVTADLKGANELAKLLHYRYRLVTLDGDVVSPGGAMTGGGAAKKTASLLGRNRELETIAAKLREMDDVIARLERDMAAKRRERAEWEAEAAMLKEEIARLQQSLQEEKEEQRELEWQKKRIDERLALYDEEKANDEREIAELNNRLGAIDGQLQQLAEKLQAIDEDINRLQVQKQTEQTTKEALQVAITEKKIALAETKERVKHARRKAEEIEAELAETARGLQQAERERAALQAEMEAPEWNEEELEQLRQQKLEDKQKTLELITSRREQRLDCQRRLEHLEQEWKEAKRQHKQLVEVVKDEEVKLNRLDVELANLLSRLSEEYGLSFEAARSGYPLEIGADEARKRVKLIKRAIEELGTVNLGAIDEYERVSERHRFLSEQKADLEEAKATLHQVIEEMDEEMKKRFFTTFEQIRAHFSEVFRELFGGGRADLRLTDPNNLLETGVDIVAQPPGKKLQHLSLLSGGERALTAIALLFSILKVRPVPFCVLDEVEAALDEANVQRYAQYLKRFSRDTQFIVITHRKGTMEEADVLYGVTMQESGVSKLVSVRLEDSKQLVQS